MFMTLARALRMRIKRIKSGDRNTREFPICISLICVFGQKNMQILFIKPSTVSKIYVFQKFYRWDKPSTAVKSRARKTTIRICADLTAKRFRID